MVTRKPKSDRPDQMPIIVVPIVRCPKCGSERFQTTATRLRKDGTRVRYSACRECGQRFRIKQIP